MKLYHFTSGTNLRAIGLAGLTVGDVPTRLPLEGKCGVWFTSDPGADGHGLTDLKKQFRLTVEVPEDKCVKWSDWAEKNVEPRTYDILSNSGFLNNSKKDRMDHTWHVYFGHIGAELIDNVYDMFKAVEVHDWKTIWPEKDSRKPIFYLQKNKWHKDLLKQISREIKRR